MDPGSALRSPVTMALFDKLRQLSSLTLSLQSFDDHDDDVQYEEYAEIARNARNMTRKNKHVITNVKPTPSAMPLKIKSRTS